MIPVLLILVPLIAGLLTFFIKNDEVAKKWTILASLIVLAISLSGLTIYKDSDQLQKNLEWLPLLGSRFHVELDGMGQLLCLLTAVAFPVILIATYYTSYKKAYNFYALMLLSQAGLMGVFLAMDALLFYFLLGTGFNPRVFSLFVMGR
jgi:NADH-quinone oxidoreductase subunit M